MAAWTSAQLRNEALRELNVVSRSETPSANDAGTMDDVWASLYPRLVRRGMAPFDTTSIPDWAQQPLKVVLAGEAAHHFGYSGGRLMEKQMAAKEGQAALRTYIRETRRAPTKFTNY